jgi:nitrogen fixation protein NifB
MSRPQTLTVLSNGGRLPDSADVTPCLQREPSSFEHLVKRHPCLSPGAHFRYGRIHLPVSPACNIQCAFCQRRCNKSEDRPGFSRCVLRPEQCLDKVRQALQLCPDISVVGIAGPGDTLASDHALTTFSLIHRELPDLIKCMSTNGLMLAERADEVVRAGVSSVTVTINGVDPAIASAVASSVHWRGRILSGREAGEILVERQLLGVRSMAVRNVLVKINTVLIPGVNDRHIGEIAQTAAAQGASRINIIPLIPQHDMANLPAPSCRQLQEARSAAERYLTVFRHCKHCRADAMGVPGLHQDFSAAIYDEPTAATFSHG